MSVAAVDYESILADEGLAPLDRPELQRKTLPNAQRMVRRQEVSDPARAEAVEAWARWARDILKMHKFDSDHQRSVWRLYSSGKTLTQIAGELFLSRRAVTRAIERVERWAPPAPVGNPWSKQHRPRWETDDHRREAEVRGMLLRTNRRVAVRVCMLALRCADKSRLREIFDGDEGLLALVPPDEPKENTMAEAKRMTYDLIALKRGHEIDIPKRRPPGARRVDRFQHVEGRPHAGGIDVEMETRDGKVDTMTVITLPWDIIAQADRARPDDSAGAE